MLTIQEILRGCEVGRIQTVGSMQVIPLTMDVDLQDRSFASPTKVKVRTLNYGALGFENPDDQDVLIPAHAAYMVKQAAQDHAMATAGILPRRQKYQWENAMCIQETQGGLIPAGVHQLAVLPLALRETANTNRGKRLQYNTLWDSIRSLGEMGRGNLVQFVDRYAQQLDQFVAEFELVHNQVGAIILINGEVVGFERAPNSNYWRDVWEPLIRTCYGSAAVVASRKAHTANDALKTRVPIEVRDLTSLDDLAAELERVEKKQDELAKKQVRQLLDDPFSEDTDQSYQSKSVMTVENDQFCGQVCRDDRSSKILYVSLVTRTGWDERKGWRLAEKFSI